MRLITVEHFWSTEEIFFLNLLISHFPLTVFWLKKSKHVNTYAHVILLFSGIFFVCLFF